MIKPQITVVGSFVVDLMSRTPHMPQPGETVLGGPFKMGPGGKGGNQAVAAARQGSSVSMVTKLGKDLFGEMALTNFKKEKINTTNISMDSHEETGTALIIVDDDSENMIVVSLGACGKLSHYDVNSAEEQIKNSAILLVQLETSLEAVETTLALGSRHGVPVVLNPAPYHHFPIDWLHQVSYITPNETEASLLTGIEVSDESSALVAAKWIYERGVDHVLITLGKKGCFYFNGKGNGKLYPGFKVEAVDTTGAGDAFNGGFAHALANEQSVEEAINYANAVAALSVTKIGTAPAMPSKEEVEQLLMQSNF